MNDSTLPPTSAESGKNITQKQRQQQQQQQQQPRRQVGTAPARGPVVARNTARNRVALRRGFGLHDWSLLCRSARDLAQRKGAPLRPISPEEIAQHASVHDAWIALHGKVYNITPYLHYHPGGVDIFKPCLGGDASELFDKYHRWVNTQGLIGVLQLGYLDESAASAKAKKAKENDGTGTSRSAAAAAFVAAPSTDADGFAMPAPRPPRGGNVPSLLGKQDGDDDDSDEEEEDLIMS